jgi:hypothetical protein
MAVPLQAIVIAVLIHILWGGNPVAVKYSLLVFPPLWTAFFRFAIAIVCVAIWAKMSGVSIWPARHEWRPLALIGTLFTVQIAAMNIGFDLTTGSMGAVLIATNPIFAALFAHILIAGDRLSAVKSIGLLVAFAGSALVLMRGSGDLQLAHGAWGNVILLMSACLLDDPFAAPVRPGRFFVRNHPVARNRLGTIGRARLPGRDRSGSGLLGVLLSHEALRAQCHHQLQLHLSHRRRVAERLAAGGRDYRPPVGRHAAGGRGSFSHRAQIVWWQNSILGLSD